MRRLLCSAPCCQPRNAAASLDTLNTRLASDFLTDGTPWTITGISAQMGNTAFITHTITFSIFTDNGSGKPGNLVSVFDTPASLPAGESGIFTATTTGINLQANTPYWVVGQVDVTPELGTVSWDFNLGEGTDGSPFTTVSGTQIQRSLTAGVLYSDIDKGNFMFALQGDITLVPEPQNWLALLVTVGTFVTFRWWRQRRVSLGSLPDRGHAS
jgi:hypothetical protein